MRHGSSRLPELLDVLMKNFVPDLTKKRFHCITVGRANLDLYPPVGLRLDTTRSYDVFVGGTPANVAVGLARLGLQVSIITRVMHDRHGTFVVNYLSRQGVNVEQVQYDSSSAKTSLAFAERRPDADTIMYRNNAADLLLEPQDINPEFIELAASVFVSGTALAVNPSRSAVHTILRHAHKFSLLRILDIDYRPYGWESPEHASRALVEAAAYCDIIIGTQEEYAIALGCRSAQELDDAECAEYFFKREASLVIIKKGKEGSRCFYKDNQDLTFLDGPVFPVKMLKPYGAGDAFASAMLGYLLKGESLSHALKAGAASASISISGYSCTESLPSAQELEQFIAQKEQEDS